MASIFDLKTNISELAASNAGIARNNYEQYAALREISGTSFSQGVINFRFETTGTKWWVPNKTYFRVRCRLSKKDAALALSGADGIAPNLNLMNNLFQSAELQINNRTVSKITDYMGQISMLETRLSKSKQWKEIVAKNMNLVTPSFSERQNVVVSDGKDECEESWEWARQDKLGYVAGQTDGTDTGTTVSYAITAATNEIKFANVPATIGAPAAGLANGGLRTGTTTLNTFLPGDKLRITKVLNGAHVDTEFTIQSVGYDSTGAANLQLVTATEAIVLANVAATNTSYPAGGYEADGAIYFSRGRRTNCALQAREFEIIWTPPLSIFKLPHAIPPGARVDILLNPHNENVYKFMAAETLPPYQAQLTEFDFSITNMFLYVNTLEGARVENLSYLLDLESTVVFSENITSNQFSQKNFDVPTSTYALTLAYQDREAATTNTLYSASKFHVGPIGAEKYINRFYISYAGQQLPQPDADPQWSESTNVKFLTQRWAESLMYSNGCYDPIPTESQEEWLQYGPFFHFAWPRDAADRSTRVQVFQEFKKDAALADYYIANGADSISLIPVSASAGLPDTGAATMLAYVDSQVDMSKRGNMLLFAHYREVAKITIQDSRVVNVELEIA